MKFLKTVSTKRLAAIAATVVAVLAVGATIAVASGGSVPVATPLANAIHDALSGPQVTGVSARITFSNHLIDAGTLPGQSPLLSGASGRLWWSADHGLRLELQGDSGDDQVVVTRSSFWIYDASSNTVYKGQLPAHSASAAAGADKSQPPTLVQIEDQLKQLTSVADVSGAIPGNVGGQPAYTVQVSPKHDGGLVGSVEGAWDAAHGVLLRAAIYAKGDSTPVVELRADQVSYGDVPAAAFDLQPPVGAKVVELTVPAKPAAGAKPVRPSKPVTGLDAVTAAVDFKLSAPSTLAGLQRSDVRLLKWNGKSAALVTYGKGLGGIAVIERPADARPGASGATGSAQKDSGVKLPTAQVNGATAQTLGTPLGSVVQFEGGGVSYTVIGSVTQTQALAAARGL